MFAHYSDDDFAALEKTLSELKTIILAGAPHGASTLDSTKEII